MRNQSHGRPPDTVGSPLVDDLDRLFQFIREDKLDDAKRLADKLDTAFGGNDPSIDEARILIENRHWEKGADL